MCAELRSRQHGGHRTPRGRPGQFRYGEGRNTVASTADAFDDLGSDSGRRGRGGLGVPRPSNGWLALSTACVQGVLGNALVVAALALQVAVAELLALLQTSGNELGLEGEVAEVEQLALRGLGALLGGHLHDEGTTLDRVHEDKTGLEPGVGGPRTKEGDRAGALVLVVLRVNVDVAGLAHALARRVTGN